MHCWCSVAGGAAQKTAETTGAESLDADKGSVGHAFTADGPIGESVPVGSAWCELLRMSLWNLCGLQTMFLMLQWENFRLPCHSLPVCDCNQFEGIRQKGCTRIEIYFGDSPS
jgi:hypothetical protein